MKYLIFGDTHIDEAYIPELEKIFEEILEYKADVCIQLGDYFNKNKLTPKELEFGTRIAKKFKETYKRFVILSGNGTHEWLNEVNVTSYLKEIGVEVVGMEHIEQIEDLGSLYCGHYMTEESKREYGNPDITIEQLKKYALVLLGHQHSFQKLNEKMYHLGSVFYQNFNESQDKAKQIAIINKGKITFKTLKTVIPMQDFKSITELNNVPELSKVRIIYSSFAQFKKEIPSLTSLKSKYYQFITKLDFQEIPETAEEQRKPNVQKVSLQDIVNEEIEKIEDTEVKSLLKKQFEET